MSVGRSKQRLYFGYGSNLWKDQMKKRCPASTYRGIARLPSYRWLINERGYANVVQTCDDKDEVWGLVFELQQTDEVKLDINEGVPEAYTKEDLSVDFWPVSETGRPKVHEEPLRIEMLLYIDRRRMEPSIPKKEYIYRMWVDLSIFWIYR